MKRLARTQFGDPILRKKAQSIVSVNPFIKKLIKEMFFTMRRVGGVGLAAPQINQPLQLAVIEIKKNKIRPHVRPLLPTVIINPRILTHSKEVFSDWEGCLSFPNVRGFVPRYKEIEVGYLDELGKDKILKLNGFQARVFQHEIDHLEGVINVDKIKNPAELILESDPDFYKTAKFEEVV